MLSYEEVGRAADWIAQAFGSEERERYPDDDGTVTHVTLVLDGGMVFLGYPSGLAAPGRRSSPSSRTTLRSASAGTGPRTSRVTAGCSPR
jgi:uncharacterized glyoxalase superfamily protein PhnB